MPKFSKKKKWIRTDGWRGYSQPIYAIAGASDTGGWSDSPAPTKTVKSEMRKFGKYLRKNKINYRSSISSSSNMFMAKRWVIVPQNQYEKAKTVADKFLKRKGLEFLHDAD